MKRFIALVPLVGLLLAACGGGGKQLIVASTTSTQDTGLLDVLLPVFEKESGYHVKLVAVGSGQALAMAERGDADALLVHAPSAEKELEDKGVVVDRRLVMHNDFIIAGPQGDPAGIRDMKSAVDAMKAVFEAGAPFVSRGDDSGTHKLELKLWEKASLSPRGRPWYEESGQGMGATLQIANQRDAYTISDRGTYLSQRKNLDLVVPVEGDPLLLNVYHVMAVNPERFGRVNGEGARAFVEFMASEEAQEIIRTFGFAEFGEPLFVPDAGKVESDLGLE